MITFSSTGKFDKQAAILLVDQSQLNSKKLNGIPANLNEDILALSKSGQFDADSCEMFPVSYNKKMVLLVGIGRSAETSLTTLRMIIRKALLCQALSKVKSVEIIPHEDKEPVVQAILEGILIGTYAWKKYVTRDKKDQTISVADKEISIAAAKKKSYDDTMTICEGTQLTRDLINDNADLITAVYIEGIIKKLGQGNKNLKLEILGEKEMRDKGLGLHLAVNQGSPKEPKLIIAKYQGGKPNDPFIALIGKGITFDTGGLNLKPTGFMETMRSDMSGAAAVVGTLKNVLALNLPKNIIFVVALAENVIDALSFKPGDVLKSYSGKTVEIGNTDAEGRLVLADAISYTLKNYKPTHIIDIATLTGACVIALGYDYAGLMSNNDDFARDLVHSSNETDDRVWRLPSYPEIKNYVKSQIADIKNVGLPKGAAGACTAAEFLRQFVGEAKWAHLDIAGTAFVDGANRMYYGYGATGFGVRLLTHYLKNNN